MRGHEHSGGEMAEEVRKESSTDYETECRANSNNVQTQHKRKVTTTTTHYSDGTSRVTNIERGDWYDTGFPC